MNDDIVFKPSFTLEFFESNVSIEHVPQLMNDSEEVQ